MEEYWWYKKRLSNDVTNIKIEKILNFAKKKGAYSGKLLGAGNGGFLMLLIDPKKQKYFQKIFSKYINVPVKFDQTGSEIIYHKRNTENETWTNEK